MVLLKLNGMFIRVIIKLISISEYHWSHTRWRFGLLLMGHILLTSTHLQKLGTTTVNVINRRYRHWCCCCNAGAGYTRGSYTPESKDDNAGGGLVEVTGKLVSYCLSMLILKQLGVNYESCYYTNSWS